MAYRQTSAGSQPPLHVPTAGEVGIHAGASIGLGGGLCSDVLHAGAMLEVDALVERLASLGPRQQQLTVSQFLTRNS